MHVYTGTAVSQLVNLLLFSRIEIQKLYLAIGPKYSYFPVYGNTVS